MPPYTMYGKGSKHMKLNRFLVIAILLLISGIVLLGYSVAAGESSVGVFIVFPVLIGTGIWAFLGMMCVMGALLFGFMGFGARFAGFGEFNSSEPGQRQGQDQDQSPRQRTGHAVKGGGVVLIGPIPIIFGSDSKLTVVLAVLAIIMMMLMMFFLFFFL